VPRDTRIDARCAWISTVSNNIAFSPTAAEKILG
jgi:hypothetical protein